MKKMLAQIFAIVALCTTAQAQQTVAVPLKVFLEGPFKRELQQMTTFHCPSFIGPFDEYVDSLGRGPFNEPDSTVDWVGVEFRLTPNSASVLKRGAYLKANGQIVSELNVPLAFTSAELPDSAYYIVVRHKRHLAIMSANPVVLSANTSLYDFTTGQDKAYRVNQRPMNRLPSSQGQPPVYGMVGGDALGVRDAKGTNQSGEGIITIHFGTDPISDFEAVLWNFASGGSGANTWSDINMDLYVGARDLRYVILNNGRRTQVP